MPKKVEKKPEPEPEPVAEEPKKIVKKKPSVKPKEEPKEEEAPFAMKLKKTERVQREWKDPEMETVKLAHHEFEKAPQPVEVEHYHDSWKSFWLVVSERLLKSLVVVISGKFVGIFAKLS